MKKVNVEKTVYTLGEKLAYWKETHKSLSQKIEWISERINDLEQKIVFHGPDEFEEGDFSFMKKKR